MTTTDKNQITKALCYYSISVTVVHINKVRQLIPTTLNCPVSKTNDFLLVSPIFLSPYSGLVIDPNRWATIT